MALWNRGFENQSLPHVPRLWFITDERDVVKSGAANDLPNGFI